MKISESRPTALGQRPADIRSATPASAATTTTTAGASDVVDADTFTRARAPQGASATTIAQAQSNDSLQHDGKYAGTPIRNGEPTFYDPNTTSIDSVPAVTPKDRSPNGATIYFTNGIDTPPWLALDGAQRIANESGAQVRMVYNARNNVGNDILQSAVDLYGPADANPASRTLGNMLYHKLKADQRVHLIGESQGAIITRNALELAAQRLSEDGLSEEEVKDRLGNVVVETYNGAVPGPPIPAQLGGGTIFRRRGFIDGPTYIHYGNPRDELVFARMGVGQWGGARFAGEDAVIRRISEGKRTDPINTHLFRNIIDERVPWDQAVREGNVNIIKD